MLQATVGVPSKVTNPGDVPLELLFRTEPRSGSSSSNSSSGCTPTQGTKRPHSPPTTWEAEIAVKRRANLMMMSSFGLSLRPDALEDERRVPPAIEDECKGQPIPPAHPERELVLEEVERVLDIPSECVPGGGSQTIEVFVVTQNRVTDALKTLTIVVQPCTTIQELKDLVIDKGDPQAGRQRLMFAGKQLEDGRTVADYAIQQESTLHLLFRGTGGKPPGEEKFDKNEGGWGLSQPPQRLRGGAVHAPPPPVHVPTRVRKCLRRRHRFGRWMITVLQTT